MAENPLLPDDRLRSLYAQTKRAGQLDQKLARTLGRQTKLAIPARAALVAACSLHLEHGDLLFCHGADETLRALVGEPQPAALIPPLVLTQPPLLFAAAATAAGLRAAKSSCLAFAFLQADSEQFEWTAALAWAQAAQLPLVITCADSGGTSSLLAPSEQKTSSRVTWPAVRKQTNLLKLPVLTVDGEDAVAVYRCMQEAVLRARSGGGPAILWATLPTRRELRRPRPPAQQPLGRLREYLRSRRIPLQSGRNLP